jgi:tetratricopeptide (TPR) repeat protein
MAKDQQGLALSGAPESSAAFDRAIADYYGLTGDPVGVLKSALARDPGFALGGVAIAALYMIGGFRGDHPEVVSALGAAAAAIGAASERERRHLGAAQAWAEGATSQAIIGWERILADYPTDALGLRLAEDAYFFLGRPAAIRDCAARVMPAWDRGNPLTSFVLGLYAFGLEETGDLRRAEDFGREALARNPRDAWATHALAHVMEAGNRHEEGVAFLKATRADWTHAHFMAHHNGWHLALFLIEQGRFAEVLADYDRFTAPKLADDATLDRVDAASLLWRLELAGVDVGDRWAPVADKWMAHVDDHVLAFNDLHCAFAAGRSPDPDHAVRLSRSLDDYERLGSGDNRRVTSEVGRRLINGALAFADADYARAVEAILPVRNDAVRIGGSHAQRDIVNLTLIAAAERSGQWSLASALLAERAGVRATPRTKAQYAQAQNRAAREARRARRV